MKLLRIYALTVALLPLLVTAQPAWLNDGLVGEYLFNDGLKDTSGHGYHGEGTFRKVEDRRGFASHAARFSGNNAFEVPHLLDDYTYASIAFWLKWAPESDSRVPQTIFNRQTQQDASGLSLAIASDPFGRRFLQLYKYTYSTGATNIDDYRLKVNWQSDWTDKWIFICVTTEMNKSSLYVNGMLQGEAEFDGTKITGGLNRNFNFGYTASQLCCGQPPYYLVGFLDNIKVYNRTLSAESVSELFLNEEYPVRAKASAEVVKGFLVNAKVMNKGENYSEVPAVTVRGGGGAGAELIAKLNAGKIENLTILNAGKGYTTAPEIFIGSPSFETKSELSISKTETPDIPDASQAWRAVAKPEIVNGFIIDFDIIEGGKGYEEQPEIRIIDDWGQGAFAEAKMVEGKIVDIKVIEAGINYSESTLVEIESPKTVRQPLPRVVEVQYKARLMAGKHYVLQSSVDMFRWINFGSSIFALEENLIINVPVDEEKCFYRLVEVP